MKLIHFEELEAWQEARKLINLLYELVHPPMHSVNPMNRVNPVHRVNPERLWLSKPVQES